MISVYRFCLLLVLFVIVNIACFWFHSLYLGGEAINGRIENGHYFVANHGRLTEVTEVQFTANKLHGLSVLVLFGIGLLANLIVFWAGKASATILSPTLNADGWRLAVALLVIAALLVNGFGPKWLLIVVLCVLPVPLIGWFAEWFFREWGAESVVPNMDRQTHSGT